MNNGISNQRFIIGIVAAIVVSSVLSTVMVTQFLVDPQTVTGEKGDPGLQGPKGEKGETGDIGPQGLPGTWGKPDYDSGWASINTNERLVLTHGLNTTEIFVHMTGKQIMGMDTPLMIHQLYYGWAYDPTITNNIGATWFIPFPDTFPVSGDENNQVVVYRAPMDGYWQQVRVLIWRLPTDT